MLAGLVPMKALGIFDRVATGMGRALAERCTSDAEVQDLLVEAYVASYASLSQVSMIPKENRLGGSCDQVVRAIRSRTTPPALPMRILTASSGKPPELQRHHVALADRTARSWPGGTHVPVPNSGHYVHHDRPDVVVQAVTDLA
jgi:pimeloyl-ACP methyl ester carboxylesterase